MMDSAPVISITNGKCTFRASSATIMSFAMAGNGSSARSYPGVALKEVGKSYIPAAKDGYKEHGQWTQASFYSQNGAIISIQVSIGNSVGLVAQGAIFLCLRDDADLISVSALLTPDTNSTYDKVPVFTGRADVLTQEELESYGVVLLDNYIRVYMDEEEIDEIFKVSTVAKGVKKPEMVSAVTVSGKVLRVPVSDGPVRKVRIRERSTD